MHTVLHLSSSCSRCSRQCVQRHARGDPTAATPSMSVVNSHTQHIFRHCLFFSIVFFPPLFLFTSFPPFTPSAALLQRVALLTFAVSSACPSLSSSPSIYGTVPVFSHLPLVVVFLILGESAFAPALTLRYDQPCRYVLDWYTGVCKPFLLALYDYVTKEIPFHI